MNNIIKVKMTPGYEALGQPNGISRVIENYMRFGPSVGIEFVEDGAYDLEVAHAGMVAGGCDVSILHGLYFTGDYIAPAFEFQVNKDIVESVRSAYAVTVPSNWVSEIFLRDMHVRPFVVPHGIIASEWKHDFEFEPYFLYNKNRDGQDVCNSIHLDRLASIAEDVQFVSTFSKARLPNIKVTGVVPHEVMKPTIQKAGGYLSLTKETFGIGVLEALASGVPVLGWRYGGNLDIVEHGVNGYLAEPGDYDDLLAGMRYIIKYRKSLASNAVVSVRKWTWENAVTELRKVFDFALYKKLEKPSVSVIIPSYNYAHKLSDCISSINNQSFKASEVIVVDDGSTDNTESVMQEIKRNTPELQISYIKKANGGVATARNLGAKNAKSKYLCFIDADDALEPDFFKVCVNALENDKALYLAYTGLRWIKQDGTTGYSQWPGKWNFDDQLRRKNQVPTCCVMRREVIERTGGYRQRYAPHGAGSEDADLWTRMGALGMKATQVTAKHLFLYSAGSGHTSKPGYHEEDWLGWNGYLKNELHPFASYATPKERSHRVHQYDQPVVSIIIPVGPGHEDKIQEALDSVEGQTYKKWEVIVVNDTANELDLSAWPFARSFTMFNPGSGPGAARNLGAKNARGKFLLFLDADDWLTVNALELMLAHFTINKAIVYTDYYGVSTISQNEVVKFGNRVIAYDPKNQRAILRHHSDAYDCQRAQAQPADPLYHWCLVTCLTPKAWHNEIGGFDENMKSWEDVDYHWRMAQRGKCYSRLDQPLVYYRFDTGYRRNIASPESNIETAQSLLRYMAEKYEGKQIMSCTSCGGNRQRPVAPSAVSQSSARSDSNFQLVLYNHPNRGTHRVIGPSTGTDYGYRSGGDSFLVHNKDIELMPDLFVIHGSIQVGEDDDVIEEPVKELAAPKLLEGMPVQSNEKPFDLQAIPGITPFIARKLLETGVDSREKFMALTEDYLKTIEGISASRAKTIVAVITKMKNGQ